LEGIPTKNGIDHPPKNGSQTISISNYTHLTIDSSVITLPLIRGNTPLKRVDSIYGTLFNSKYGFYPPVATIGQRLKVMKELLTTYNELQLALLLIVYFNWKGMNDSNDKEQSYLQSKTHSMYTFKFNLSQYEAYVRNIAGYSKEFDESGEPLLKIVGENIIKITNK
jgi:hypothetical protein